MQPRVSVASLTPLVTLVGRASSVVTKTGGAVCFDLSDPSGNGGSAFIDAPVSPGVVEEAATKIVVWRLPTSNATPPRDAKWAKVTTLVFPGATLNVTGTILTLTSLRTGGEFVEVSLKRPLAELLKEPESGEVAGTVFVVQVFTSPVLGVGDRLLSLIVLVDTVCPVKDGDATAVTVTGNCDVFLGDIHIKPSMTGCKLSFQTWVWALDLVPGSRLLATLYLGDSTHSGAIEVARASCCHSGFVLPASTSERLLISFDGMAFTLESTLSSGPSPSPSPSPSFPCFDMSWGTHPVSIWVSEMTA